MPPITTTIEVSGPMTFLRIVRCLALTCWVYFGLATFRKGLYSLSWFGLHHSDPVHHPSVHRARRTRRGTRGTDDGVTSILTPPCCGVT